jgi:tripartite-type tricarboxylate transporter receptor subunit TctC
MQHDRRSMLRLAAAGSTTTALWALGLAAAHGQTAAAALPDTARILVGFPPGGGIDQIARRLADSLSGSLARTVITDNRPGAAGRIAVDVAMQSPADGTSLLLCPAGVLTINPHTYKKSNYDPFKDFAALSLAALIDFGFAVGPGVPAAVTNIAEFAAWARKQGTGQVTFGSPAAGAPPHFIGDVMSRHLNLGLTHVPYRGGGPALTDLMGGQIHAAVMTVGDLLQNARAGKLRLLATSGPRRSTFTPEVATFAEQNVPGLELRDWLGVFIVGKPAPAVVARATALVREALVSPGYVRGVNALNIEPTTSTAQEVDRLVQDDYRRWGAIVKASGFVADV